MTAMPQQIKAKMPESAPNFVGALSLYFETISF